MKKAFLLLCTLLLVLGSLLPLAGYRADEIIPPRHLLDLPGALVLDEEDLGVSGERGGLWRACVRAGQAPARCGQRRGGRDFR